MVETKENEKNRTSVNVTIDIMELEDIKAVTRIDMNASAILAAARIGRDCLKKLPKPNGE